MDAIHSSIERQKATRWVMRLMVVFWAMFFAAPASAQTLTISPAAWSFPATAEGATSASKSFTLTNSGSKTANINSIGVESTYSSSFPLTKTCGSTLAARKSCTITVSFKPATSPVTMTGNLRVYSNATNGIQTATLTGTSTAPVAIQVVSPTSVSFGSVGVNVTSGPKLIIVTNNGKGVLTFPASNSVTLTNTTDFAVPSNGCAGQSLPQYGSCSIGVTFKPTTSGAKSSTLKIFSNATPNGFSVALSGSGVTPTPALTLSPTKVSMTCSAPNAGPATTGILARSSGTAPVTITAINISAGGTWFSAQQGCIGTHQPGAACSIAVTFTPTGKTSRTGTLSVVTTNAGTKTASLSGSCKSHPSP